MEFQKTIKFKALKFENFFEALKNFKRSNFKEDKIQSVQNSRHFHLENF